MIMATKNQYTTLISVRLDNDVLTNLNKAQKRLQYYTRSHLINNILSCVLLCADHDTLGHILRYQKNDIFKGKIKLERDI